VKPTSSDASGGAAAQNAVSILNDVLGPVMRGPSSSHTAASYNIGRAVAALLGVHPASVRVSFDPGGSYGRVYRQQGVDLAFAAGLLGWSLTDPRFFRALEAAAEAGIALEFRVSPLPDPGHPNETDIRLSGPDGRSLEVRARSIGGGAIEITRFAGWPALLTGRAHEVVVGFAESAEAAVRGLLAADGHEIGEPVRQAHGGEVLLCARRRRQLAPQVLASLAAVSGVVRVHEMPALALVKQGSPLFSSAAEMIALAEERHCSLGRLAAEYESRLLGISEMDVGDEMARRLDIMHRAVQEGLSDRAPGMQLLAPTASRIYRADSEGRLALGGLHTRAAARAMGAMHVNSGMGVVCAAPTGGSSGVLPGVLATLVDERGLSRDQAVLALMAAGAVGIIVATRATFAAEIAGCQVEIGAAGAMAAAAVVEAAGGTAAQAADAAAISFQNTMGSVCDLVQGFVEIPCHTRNAVAASSAFVCADLVLGGYENPIPLDDTIDAVLAVGRMLPSELRVTSGGGLATTPSALRLRSRRAGSSE
jgi:L-serine dehydratase